MGSANTTNLEAFLKIKYPNGIAFQGVKASRFMGLVKKSTNFGGSGRQVKVMTSPGTGGSSEFAKALANRGPTDTVTFTVNRKYDYVVGSLENEVIEATKGDQNAIRSALEEELDKKGREFGMRIARKCVGNAGGSLGRIGSISTNTIVLESRADARNFYVNMKVSGASDSGTGTSPTGERAGDLTVTKVAPSTGTITFSQNVTTGIPNTIVGDYLFNPGDYGKSPSGILGWIPLTEPTAGDSFLGVDRSVSPHFLAGHRYSGQGNDLIEVINYACSEGFNFGAEGEYLMVNGNDMARLQNTLEGRAMTREVSGYKGAVSWKGVVVHTTYGELTVLPEPYWPEGYGLIWRPDDWEVASLGDLPHFSDTGHGKLQQESGADARQFRMVGYWNVICNNPGNQTLITFG